MFREYSARPERLRERIAGSPHLSRVIVDEVQRVPDLLPVVLKSESSPDKEEVQLEGLVRKVGAFHRFLEAITFSHAAVLNIASVARECQVERKTVSVETALRGTSRAAPVREEKLPAGRAEDRAGSPIED